MRCSSTIRADNDARVTNMMKLDPEEKEILDAFNAGTLKRTANARREFKRHREYAAVTLKKSVRRKPLVKAILRSNAS